MSSYIWCNECEDCGDISYDSSRIFQCPKCKGENITSYDESDKTEFLHDNRRLKCSKYMSWYGGWRKCDRSDLFHKRRKLSLENYLSWMDSEE